MNTHEFEEQPQWSSIRGRCNRPDCGLPPSAEVHNVSTGVPLDKSGLLENADNAQLITKLEQACRKALTCASLNSDVRQLIIDALVPVNQAEDLK